ncbi:MAG: uracil-DNA glycosylase [Herpetosiphonaceae bacterium]|nr:uracil-DNA glycosylase [Herpetosiphonaceae bacterium]
MDETVDYAAIAAGLAEIAAEVSVCTACELHKGRTCAVPGEGPVNADIFFIGEAPGRNEDETGRPFVGQAGHLLEDLLEKIGLTRDDVFIGNVVKCRPPQNRDPRPEEIAACSGYLQRQLELLKPKVVATLGRYSMEKFFPGAKITKVHGKAERQGKRVVIPLYHPAYILRNMAAMPDAVRDMQRIPRLLERLEQVLADEAVQGIKPPVPTPEPEAPTGEQLSLL